MTNRTSRVEIIGHGLPAVPADQLKPDGRLYGQNNFSGASSDTPGKRTRAAMSVNGDDTDEELNRIKRQGARKKKSEQDDDAEITGGSK